MKQQGIPPNWMPYIEADNVDDTARRATSIGGTVMHGPQDIPGTGRFAVIKDPQGAVFGIYKSVRQSQGWDGTPVLGRFSWHELMTTDYRKAFDFYKQLFGWDAMSEMNMGDGNMYSMWGSRGKMFGGMFNRPPEMATMPPFWLIYVNVKDVQKAVDATTRAGGFVQRAPMDVPGGKVAILGDPQGAAFAVHAVTDAAGSTATAKKPSATKPSAAPRKAKTAGARPKAKATSTRPTAKTASRKKTAAKKSSRKATPKRRAKTASRAKPKARARSKAKAKTARRKR
jgi:predicted enzyme related to lactoylglutathione lyase